VNVLLHWKPFWKEQRETMARNLAGQADYFCGLRARRSVDPKRRS
jgi:hypothetical protein